MKGHFNTDFSYDFYVSQPRKKESLKRDASKVEDQGNQVEMDKILTNLLLGILDTI